MRALVIGAGSFGATVAVEMAARNCEVILIDNDAEKLDDLKDLVAQVIVGDATDKDLLMKISKDMDWVIVALGEKIDVSLLITYRLKDLGVTKIIAKAMTKDHGEILRLIVASQVIFPEHDEAKRLVHSLISPDFLNLVKLSDQLNILEAAVPTDFISKSIKQMDIRKKYGLQVLAIKNPLMGKTVVMPAPDYVFQADDIMVVIGDNEQLEKLSKS